MVHAFIQANSPFRKDSYHKINTVPFFKDSYVDLRVAHQVFTDQNDSPIEYPAGDWEQQLMDAPAGTVIQADDFDDNSQQGFHIFTKQEDGSWIQTYV